MEFTEFLVWRGMLISDCFVHLCNWPNGPIIMNVFILCCCWRCSRWQANSLLIVGTWQKHHCPCKKIIETIFSFFQLDFEQYIATRREPNSNLTFFYLRMQSSNDKDATYNILSRRFKNISFFMFRLTNQCIPQHPFLTCILLLAFFQEAPCIAGAKKSIVVWTRRRYSCTHYCRIVCKLRVKCEIGLRETCRKLL